MSFGKRNLFKKFIERVGQGSEFKPLKNRLFSSMKKESEKDTERYNYLLELLNTYWQKYKEGSEIAYFLEEHYEEIFIYFLNKIFPFRSEALSFEGAKAMTPVDFIIIVRYLFNQTEIESIEEVKWKLKIKDKTNGILKRTFCFAVSSIAPIIEKIFGRSFAAQFFKIKAKKVKKSDMGEILVTVAISLREQ